MASQNSSYVPKGFNTITPNVWVFFYLGKKSQRDAITQQFPSGMIKSDDSVVLKNGSCRVFYFPLGNIYVLRTHSGKEGVSKSKSKVACWERGKFYSASCSISAYAYYNKQYFQFWQKTTGKVFPFRFNFEKSFPLR